MAERILRAPKGATKKMTRVGRGDSAGRGSTCGRGHKGQNARSGGGVRPGFEGGQMPLYRRIARKGFSNYPFKKEFIILNLESLERNYSDGDTVSMETLKEKKLIKKTSPDVKILGKGELTKKLTVEVEKISKSAREKIEKAGGKVAAAPEIGAEPEAAPAKKAKAKTAKPEAAPAKTKAKPEAKVEAAPAKAKAKTGTKEKKGAAVETEEVKKQDAQEEVKAEEQDS